MENDDTDTGRLISGRHEGHHIPDRSPIEDLPDDIRQATQNEFKSRVLHRIRQSRKRDERERSGDDGRGYGRECTPF